LGVLMIDTDTRVCHMVRYGHSMGRGETLGIVGILAVIACVMRSGQLCSLVQCSAAKHNASETN
jgi:hypothetical protein